MTDLKAQTALIDLDKVDLASDARPHDPAALEILAHDMGDQGQLQEVIVESENGRYSVIAGVGRTLAARKLGWKEIRASVRESVSDFDKARITFAENEDREDADPFYQASQIDKMLKAKGCTQQELAKELGLSPALVSGYMAVNGLPKEIGQQFRRLNLGQLTQIARLNNTDSQIEFSANCAKNELSVRQLKALVDRALKKPSSGKRHSAPPPIPDPLAEVWSSLLGKLNPAVYWEMNYGTRELPDKSKRLGWFVFISPLLDQSSRRDMGRWFKAVGQALDGEKVDDGMLESIKEIKRAEQVVMGNLKPRIPKNAAEEAELAHIAATQGPKAVYAWIYGADSPMVQAVPFNSWEELGTTATEGLKQILDGIRQFQKA